MIPNKPKNHVAEAMEAIRQDAVGSAAWPDIPEDLVLHLEGLFPPTCYRPGHESLEEHLIYSGQVDLVQTLRAVFERQKAEAEDDAEGEAGAGAVALEGLRWD